MSDKRKLYHVNATIDVDVYVLAESEEEAIDAFSIGDLVDNELDYAGLHKEATEVTDERKGFYWTDDNCLLYGNNPAEDTLGYWKSVVKDRRLIAEEDAKQLPLIGN